jgi:indole-3-glycerol phosphate synthase
MTTTAAPDLLATIVAATRHIVSVRERTVPRASLEREAARRLDSGRPGGDAFADALRSAASPRIIAECKRRSPSRGLLRREYDPASHAAAYQAAGAIAISVLTEPTFFDGALEHLERVRAAVSLPVLRKDFIVSEYQIVEGAAAGGDAVLLIVGALEDAALRRLLRFADDLDVAALVEIHDVVELTRALDAGAQIVGVNSRNLRTLTVDPGVFDAVAAALPDGITAVAESGLRTPGDLRRLTSVGYHAFLVGERLMSEGDPGTALRELREQQPNVSLPPKGGSHGSSHSPPWLPPSGGRSRALFFPWLPPSGGRSPFGHEP